MQKKSALKFAANLDWMYLEMPFADRFAAAARDGFKGVEILNPYVLPPNEIAAMLKHSKLSLVLLNAPANGKDAASANDAWNRGERGTTCIPGLEAEFRAGLDLASEYAEVLECKRIHVMAGILPQGIDRKSAQAVFVANLIHAVRKAENRQVQLLIEPINSRDIPAYFLKRQCDAEAVVRDMGSPHLKMQMDLYHCQVEEGDVAIKVRKHVSAGMVDHIQIAGAPGRNEPDVGELHYPYLFSVLEELGYEGWIGCEYAPSRGKQPGATTEGLGWFRQLTGEFVG